MNNQRTSWIREELPEMTPHQMKIWETAVGAPCQIDTTKTEGTRILFNRLFPKVYGHNYNEAQRFRYAVQYDYKMKERLKKEFEGGTPASKDILDAIGSLFKSAARGDGRARREFPLLDTESHRRLAALGSGASPAAKDPAVTDYSVMMNRTYFSLEKQIKELETEPVENRKAFISINRQLGLLNEELENHFFEAHGGVEQWIYHRHDATHTSLGVFSQNWSETDHPRAA